ncbi:MAG: flagellar assembly protein FliH [Alphaproteobacteria bacterium]|nr:flagellar assembly protein FliH [Alphaproteobacteria bacterium]MBU1515480.1 flagellar assembly protein FliH [Alphaproteobacteria bacterium]MBU2095478.1 flagellar assembly protein FliH [Alphaproteobacteria bacterium]MBU2150719.1 flagellar assembly protein FliH [Alphaproteobacteria bacterium]MBU2306984.1 flagellar assembly protein FliH [Alphaproteobacteria bacterium]
MSEAHQKFSFDTEFDAGGGVAFAPPRPKRLFPADEVEQLQAVAFAEGERAAMASIAAQQANALSQIAIACDQALPRLAQVAHEHRQGSATLALACARAIADAALEKFPQAPIQAALETLAREIDAQPRLVVTADPALAENLQSVLEDTARGLGFEGAVVIKPDGAYGRHAFTLDFGDGQAAFDPAQAAGRVTLALEAALAAEGLHAEPLIPGSES